MSDAETSKPDASTQFREKRYDVCSKRLILTDAGLKALDDYKYTSGEYTPIDNFLNKYLWTPGAKFLPLWMAPNLVTLIGFSFVITAFLLQSWYSSDFGEKEIPPRWVNAIVAINMFIYQTMDAMDGKQARRTGTSSPLGQLFDHGIDATSTTILGFMTLTGMGVGLNVKAASAVFAALMSFWFAQWGEYHTHTMNHSAGGYFGSTEAQFCSIFAVLASAVFGSEIFSSAIPGTSITLSDICWAVSVVSGVSLSVLSIRNVLSTKTVNLLQASVQTIPIFVLIFLGCSWASLPLKHPMLVLSTCGVVFTYLTLRMVLCAMTQMEYPTCPTILWPLPMLFFVDLFRLMPDWSDLFLGMYFSYTVYKTYKFIIYTIHEITSHLNINCLTIPYPVEEPKDK